MILQLAVRFLLSIALLIYVWITSTLVLAIGLTWLFLATELNGWMLAVHITETKKRLKKLEQSPTAPMPFRIPHTKS